MIWRPPDEDGIPLTNIEQDPQPHEYAYERPLTRDGLKQLQHEVNLFLDTNEHISLRNHVIPNGDALLVLRFEAQGMDGKAT